MVLKVNGSYISYYDWGNWIIATWNLSVLFLISYNCIQIYNDLKIKSEKSSQVPLLFFKVHVLKPSKCEPSLLLYFSLVRIIYIITNLSKEVMHGAHMYMSLNEVFRWRFIE